MPLKKKNRILNPRKFSKNRKKSFSFLILLIIILAAGYYFYNQKSGADEWSGVTLTESWFRDPTAYNANARKKSYKITCRDTKPGGSASASQIDFTAQISPTLRSGNRNLGAQAFVRQHSNTPRRKYSIEWGGTYSISFTHDLQIHDAQSLNNDGSLGYFSNYTGPDAVPGRNTDIDTFKFGRTSQPSSVFGGLVCYPKSTSTYTIGNVSRVLLKKSALNPDTPTSNYTATVTPSQ